MNALTPYAAFFMRLAVGGVFLRHGIAKYEMGVGATAQFFGAHHIPLATISAVIVMTVETIGALCVLFGILTRAWAAAMAVEMLVAIVAVKLPAHQSLEIEALLLAGAVTLVALGDGPLSIAVRFRQGSSS